MEEHQEAPRHPRFQFVTNSVGDFLQRGNGMTIESDDITPEALHDIARENAAEIYKRCLGYRGVYLVRVSTRYNDMRPLSPRGIQIDRTSHHHDDFLSIDENYAGLWAALMTAQFMPTMRTHVHDQDPAINGIWLGSRLRQQLDPPFFSEAPFRYN